MHRLLLLGVLAAHAAAVPVTLNQDDGAALTAHFGRGRDGPQGATAAPPPCTHITLLFVPEFP